MSHFLFGVPIEISELDGPAWMVQPITTPELGFKFKTMERKGEWVQRDIEKAAEAFMAIKTYEDALAVFSVYGPLFQDHEFTSFELVKKYVRAAWNVRTASLSDITRVYKSRLQEGDHPDMRRLETIEDGLTAFEPTVTIRLEDPPRLQIRPPSCCEDLMGALIVILHLELLQGIRHKFCSLDDCRKPFQLKGDTDKKFCSYDCGHKSAVRASRQRAKEAKAKRSSRRSTKGKVK